MNGSPSRRLPTTPLAWFDVLLPFIVLVVFLNLGQFVQSILGTWIPGSVIGMALLFLALSAGLVPDALLDRTSDWLLDRLGLFFVCPGVEVINYLGLVESHWLSLTLAIVGSSAVTLVVTGWVGEGRISRKDHKEVGRSVAHRGSA